MEPVLSETVAATYLSMVREATARGVPAGATRGFALVHLNVWVAILFNEID